MRPSVICPAPGDEDEICGGKDRLNVFEAAEPEEEPEERTDEPGSIITANGPGSTPATSGAKRNFALF